MMASLAGVPLPENPVLELTRSVIESLEIPCLLKAVNSSLMLSGFSALICNTSDSSG
jgi:hypothetical protein